MQIEDSLSLYVPVYNYTDEFSPTQPLSTRYVSYTQYAYDVRAGNYGMVPVPVWIPVDPIISFRVKRSRVNHGEPYSSCLRRFLLPAQPPCSSKEGKMPKKRPINIAAGCETRCDAARISLAARDS
jgi:hypothetical protein